MITLPRPDGTSEQSIADENRGHQQQEHSDEPASTFRFTQPTAAEHSHSEVDTFYVRHALTPAPTDDQEKMPDGNTDCTSAPGCQSNTIAIPSKQSYPFGKDAPRKKRKVESYILVRIYEQRKDLEHMNEIEYPLTPDGGLDLVGLSQKLNVRQCQASRFNIIPICGVGYADCLLRCWTPALHDRGLASALFWKAVPLGC